LTSIAEKRILITKHGVYSNLIYAYQASLKMIVNGSPSLEDRFKLHIEASDRLKGEVQRLGLKQVRGGKLGLIFVHVFTGLFFSLAFFSVGSRGQEGGGKRHDGHLRP
jgi:aspartate aminotransferase-like enzyme